MEQLNRGISFETLLCLYNQEIDILKEKLINGESWENLRTTRQNITELGIALQKWTGDKRYLDSRNPAELPKAD